MIYILKKKSFTSFGTTIHDSNLKKESWNFIIIEPKIKIKFQKKAKINIHAHVNKRWHRFHYISICRNTSIVKMLPKRDLTCWSMIKNFRCTVYTLHIWVRLCFYHIMLRLFHWIFHKSNEDRKFLSTYMYVMCLVEYHTYMQKFHSNCYWKNAKNQSFHILRIRMSLLLKQRNKWL